MAKKEFMIKLVTFANDKMTQSAELCMDSARRNGVDKVNCYSSSWWSQWKAEDTFEWLNKDILNQQRGCGFWLWKPWTIAHAMSESNEGDILIYSDAGQEFIGDVRQVIKCMKGDIMLFNNGFAHIEWCKADVLHGILNICPGDNTIGSRQPQASLQIYRISKESKDFVKQWLLYCQMPGFIDDSPSKIPNDANFAEHRHDQAILGCVRIKYNIPLHWYPSTMNMHRLDMKLPGDDYPAIVNHHRKRNAGTPGNDPTW